MGSAGRGRSRQADDVRLHLGPAPAHCSRESGRALASGLPGELADVSGKGVQMGPRSGRINLRDRERSGWLRGVSRVKHRSAFGRALRELRSTSIGVFEADELLVRHPGQVRLGTRDGVLDPKAPTSDEDGFPELLPG